MPERKPQGGPVVVKVGGSVFDLPDLGPRLHRWLAHLGTFEVLLLPGGGATADVVRDLDRCHGLGEERSHWLALRALTLNAEFLAALLPGAVVVRVLDEARGAWQQGHVPILDAHAFACADEAAPDHLPHAWAVTSDAVAARVAQRLGAARLVLLKSTALPPGCDWPEASRLGIVDAHFPGLVTGLAVTLVNLRAWPG